MAIHIDTQKMIDTLKQDRDELRLRLHLASMEMQDQWHEVEHKWDNVSLKMQKAADEADEASGDIHEALHLLLDEIREGYRKIRKAL